MESARSSKAQTLSGLPAANNMKVLATNDTSRASSTDFEDCDVSDVENDTSSDGGSTVREINAQLEDSNTEWEKAGGKKRGRQILGLNRTPTFTESKRGRQGPLIFLYVKSTEFNIAKETISQPICFKRKLTKMFGEVSGIKVLKDCIRITCLSEKTEVQNTRNNRMGQKSDRSHGTIEKSSR